jgi:hypothetical protein
LSRGLSRAIFIVTQLRLPWSTADKEVSIYKVQTNLSLKNLSFVTWFVNTSSHFYLDGIDKNAVTMACINEFRDVQQIHGEALLVVQYFDKPEDWSKFVTAPPHARKPWSMTVTWRTIE